MRSPGLNQRPLEILALMLLGHTDAEIAEMTGTSKSNVTHAMKQAGRELLMEKKPRHSIRCSLFVKAIAEGWVEADGKGGTRVLFEYERRPVRHAVGGKRRAA